MFIHESAIFLDNHDGFISIIIFLVCSVDDGNVITHFDLAFTVVFVVVDADFENKR